MGDDHYMPVWEIFHFEASDSSLSSGQGWPFNYCKLWHPWTLVVKDKCRYSNCFPIQHKQNLRELSHFSAFSFQSGAYLCQMLKCFCSIIIITLNSSPRTVVVDLCFCFHWSHHLIREYRESRYCHSVGLGDLGVTCSTRDPSFVG